VTRGATPRIGELDATNFLISKKFLPARSTPLVAAPMPTAIPADAAILKTRWLVVPALPMMPPRDLRGLHEETEAASAASVTPPRGDGASPDIEVVAGCAGDPRMPDGIYTVRCIDVELVKMRFGRQVSQKIVLHFEVTGGAHDGARLRYFIPRPESKRGPAPSSKFVRAWTIASGRPPARRERMSTRVFLDKAYRVATRTVIEGARTQRSMADRKGGVPLADVVRYSVVDSLLERLLMGEPY
jgi:hypothetical protein